MIPGRYPLLIYRGDTYKWRVVIWLDDQRTQPFDLSNVTPKAEIRDAPGSMRFVQQLGCTIIPPNTIELLLATSASNGLPETGVWDLQLNNTANETFTILRGDVTVITDVTDSRSIPVVTPSGLAAFPKRGRAA